MGTRAPFAAAAFVVSTGIMCILQGCTTDTVVEKMAAPVADAGAPAEGAAQKPPPPEPDAGPDVDNGAPSDVFPAPHAAPRRLEKLPGPVLAHPVIVPVFFGDDADRAKTEALLQQLPGSSYWKQLAEYGVGDVTIGASVVLTDVAPATYSLESIDTKVSALWTRATNPGPVPDGTQIYRRRGPTRCSSGSERYRVGPGKPYTPLLSGAEVDAVERASASERTVDQRLATSRRPPRSCRTVPRHQFGKSRTMSAQVGLDFVARDERADDLPLL